MILWELFIRFFRIGLLSYGGGYASFSLIEQQIVHQKHWMTPTQFIDVLTVSEMTPGPIGINAATFVGRHVRGFPGATVATLGVILPSFFIVTSLAALYFKFKNIKIVQGIIEGLRPAVIALIASAGVSIMLTALFEGAFISLETFRYFSFFLMIGCFILLRKTNLSPIKVMIVSGVIGMIVYSF